MSTPPNSDDARHLVFDLSIKAVQNSVRSAFLLGSSCDSCGKPLLEPGCQVENLQGTRRRIHLVISNGDIS